MYFLAETTRARQLLNAMRAKPPEGMDPDRKAAFDEDLAKLERVLNDPIFVNTLATQARRLRLFTLKVTLSQEEQIMQLSQLSASIRAKSSSAETAGGQQTDNEATVNYKQCTKSCFIAFIPTKTQ